jgi:hypothetical protein
MIALAFPRAAKTNESRLPRRPGRVRSHPDAVGGYVAAHGLPPLPRLLGMSILVVDRLYVALQNKLLC